MSTKYKATMPDTGYFVTITIVGCCGHGLQIRAIGNKKNNIIFFKGVNISENYSLDLYHQLTFYQIQRKETILLFHFQKYLMPMQI